ncbi:hypothetical protein [Algibacter lectus]|uniref:hypothetical protein n=1 Tax=Algibacter lectus TaxID=221126 RepID=UPI0005A6B96D|nr:hypothetical protein [Algibacter lectus]
MDDVGDFITEGFSEIDNETEIHPPVYNIPFETGEDGSAIPRLLVCTLLHITCGQWLDSFMLQT